MKIHSLLVLPVIAIILLSSCKPQKAIGYLEDFTDTSGKAQVKYPEPLIQKNDILSIVVYSDAIDQGTTDRLYNLANTGINAATQGYLVDNEGYIQYPRVGKLKADGLTKHQLSEEITKRLSNELKNPSVIIRLANFKITMLGEVARPGPISLPSEKVTILEAIGLAGDISVYGKKDDIVVLRDVDGSVEHGKVDLYFGLYITNRFCKKYIIKSPSPVLFICFESDSSRDTVNGSSVAEIEIRAQQANRYRYQEHRQESYIFKEKIFYGKCAKIFISGLISLH